MKCADRNWKPFRMGAILDIMPGKRLEKINMVPGNTPFIGSSDRNNGVTAFCGNRNESLDANVLGLNYNGSVCEAFYHPYQCLFSDDVKRLKLKYTKKNNKYVLLFIGTCIRQQKIKYMYSYKFNEKRMLSQSILLPTQSNGDPDYNFMEAYVKEMIMKKIAAYRDYLVRQIQLGAKYPECNDWKSFRLGAIGKISSGRDIYAHKRVSGEIPYITSGSQNNGIGHFVGNKNDTYDKGYIAFNRNGSVGLAFYHPYWSVMGNDCRKLHISAANGNPYISLFVCTAISKQSKAFSYSRKLGTKRANCMQIMLPVNQKGEPDWEFMESYGRQMMLKKYRQYLDYLESRNR